MTTEIHWTVTDQEADIIFRSLAEQPYKIVAQIIQKLLNQANGGQPAPGTSAEAVAAAHTVHAQEVPGVTPPSAPQATPTLAGAAPPPVESAAPPPAPL